MKKREVEYQMRKWISFLLAAVMMFSFAACTTSPTTPGTNDGGTNADATTSTTNTESDTYKIGFALQTLEVAVWQRMVNGMEQAAKDKNVEFTCFVANSDVAKQIANIENMISMSYDAIIVHVFDTQAFADVVQEALDAGIVICAYDDVIVNAATDENLDYQFSFVCDNYEIGYRVGTMCAEWTKATFDTEEPLEVGCLWHPEYQLQWDRVEGMKAALAEKDPRVKIVEELEGLLVEDGVKAAETWIQTYPNMVGVVATNDTCLQGFSEAWAAAGKDLSDPLFGMFGNDGVQDAIDMVAAGQIIRGDVGLDVYNGGYETVEACITWIEGGSTEDIIMPMINVTYDSAEEWTSDPNLYG